MAVEDNPPPPPHASTDKIIPFSIPNKIPIKLDLEKLNYNSWSSFSLIHLGSLGLKSHVEEDTASTNPEWCQLDDLIKMWILGSLCDSLQEQVVTTPVNGLDSRCATLVEIIRHREPLPTFETVRNMLLLKESSFNEPTDASTMLESSSSSPTILMASSSSDAKGATSRLISNARNLSTIFNKRLFPSIYVGDDNSILVTNIGHSIIPSLHRPLHLHNVLDFLTRHILLRCDSSGDLYPVTKPSTLPNAFVSTSSTTWHQRLGHPGDEVLRSLTSRHFISCNKEKSTHICHACQLAHEPHTPPTTAYHTHDPTHHNSPNAPEPTRTHRMVTRSQSSIVKPIDRLSLYTSSISPIPKSLFLALKDPNWCNAMYDEYNALVKNGTWILVPRPSDVNLVRFMWLFKHKFHVDGTLIRYKARLVANGSSQKLDGDFDETFSPVVKPATIRTVLSLAVSRQWPIHQLDVNNAFLNASSPVLLQQIKDSLHKEFDMTDIGVLNYFLGIFAIRHSTWLFLSHKKYALQLIKRAHMVNCNPSWTPVDTKAKLGLNGVPIQDLTLYRSLAGGSSILPLLAQICLMQFNRFVSICMIRGSHILLLSNVSCAQGTLEFGLHLYASDTTSLVCYNDVDWVGCPSTRRYTSGYCVFMGDNLLSWSSKRQHTISRSSAEAEYRGVANVVAETAWVHNLLCELHSPILTATLVYCDNVSDVYMFANPIQHQRTKILRLIFTSFVIWLPLVMFEFFMYHLVFSMPISSPRDFHQVSIMKEFLNVIRFNSYACSDSLLLTPLCCDDIHEVTPRVSALTGCDRLVSEPLVIEKSKRGANWEGAPYGTKGDRVGDRLSNARS
ncbi:ribonuclease H-like domain-containing protein [Tanacetum coccineum]